ncbi:MAG: electron transfer flavoprotein-ubiquinone oxidoreductase [Acidobacteriota bacterium]|nr:electron transfer flavoprotein-ubiquinone oxidoreductase [Acidobacteriota bacterium]
MTSTVERETLDVDVLIVGGGPAGLSAALKLSQLQKRTGGEPLSIAVLEKARETGAHMMSGAVLDVSALKELVPDFLDRQAPLASEVHEDHIYFLTPGGKLRFPITPAPFRNHGNYIISLNRFVKWLSEQVEAEGIDIFSGFAGREVLYDGDRVIGVRTGDRGIDKHGQPRDNFEPGVDIHAKVTIFADGVRGNLTKELQRRFQLGAGREPQSFAIGIKELWEVPAGRIRPGTVIHTMGYPLNTEEFGGGFVYAMPDNRVFVGFVSGLDYVDPMFDPHVAFQRFKLHPLVRGIIEGGQMIRYGAKALPEGGWNTIPRPYLDGALIVGDAAGFMNSMRLKGIHLAMRSGMLAADAAFEAVNAGDASAARLKRYETLINASPIRKELYPVRNVHQAFGHGFVAGFLYAGIAMVTNGWWFDRMTGHAGQDRIQTIARYYTRRGRQVPEGATQAVKPDRQVTFDKLTNVHYSGTRHDEDQPVHLLVHTEVCESICGPEYNYPCQRFCPANVYEIVTEAVGNRLQINASNCVHCKTCDIMDPYQVITWVPPEGGGGPQYDGM